MTPTMTGLRRGPRPVPWTTQLVVLLGRPAQTIGWLVFAFGMIFVWIFGAQADWSSWRFRGKLETARGQLTALEKTSFSQGGGKQRKGTPIYASHYTFQRNGTEHQGRSYRVGRSGQAGDPVTVEFPAGNPSLSRLRGQRRAPFSLAVTFVFIFPAVGLALALPGLWRGRRELRLVRRGELARAKLIRKEPTNVMVNKMMVFRLTFEFTDALDRRHEAVARTEQPARLEDESEESLFYDPHRPSRAVLLDDLPGRQRLLDNGTMAPNGVGRTVASVLPALLAFLMVAVGVWWKWG